MMGGRQFDGCDLNKVSKTRVAHSYSSLFTSTSLFVKTYFLKSNFVT